jgi:xanthine/uracil/vitamin C permease (AzgA family)
MGTNRIAWSSGLLCAFLRWLPFVAVASFGIRKSIIDWPLAAGHSLFSISLKF